MAVRKHVVTGDGSRLGVELVGSGPRVLFVHGGTADRTRWARLVEHLADVMTLCLLDRRGRGLSRAESPGPYTWRREAADIATVAEALGARVVIAHSYGGLCALGALRMTSEIDRAVIYEPTVPTPQLPIIPPGALEQIADLLAADQGDEALSTFFTQVIGATPEDVDRRRGTDDWRARLDALPTALREGAAVAAVDVEALALEEIRVPVTVLVGTTSPAPLASGGRAVAARLAYGELVELEGRGHTAIDEDPQAFARTLLDLLAVDRV